MNEEYIEEKIDELSERVEELEDQLQELRQELGKSESGEEDLVKIATIPKRKDNFIPTKKRGEKDGDQSNI